MSCQCEVCQVQQEFFTLWCAVIYPPIFFRCDSISWQLPLSVSQSVSQSVSACRGVVGMVGIVGMVGMVGMQ